MIDYISLFSGIGAFECAFKNLKIPYNLIGFSEIDKYAVKSYTAIHNIPDNKNLGDITRIDETQLPQVDLVTYGFPCQDISIAGNQKGLFNEDGSKTRSGLFFDALRIIKHCKPKVAIAENVRNLTAKRFSEQFQIVLDSLEKAGYNNYWKILNSKDYGIPQNRERVLIISIRKDVDNKIFSFPKSYTLEKRLKDLLQDEVDEKYYIYTNRSKALCEKLNNAQFVDTDEVSVIGDLWEDNGHNSMAGRVYNPNGIAPTLGASHFQQIKYIAELTPPILGVTDDGGGYIVRNANKKGYDVARYGDTINMEQPNSLTRRGRVGHGVAQTLTTSCNQATVEQSLKIRKLTPNECFRLMGFNDEDFEKASKVNSDTQLYKQAGNSIVVDVIEELLCMLLGNDDNFLL